MKKSALVLAACIVLLGCGDESQMKSAIDDALESHPLCFTAGDRGQNMPVVIAAPAEDAGLNPILAAARDAEFIKIGRRMQGTEGDTIKISLTDAGRDAHIWDKDSASMCIGNLKVASIDEWVEAHTAAGVGRKVQVTVKRVNAPEWAAGEAFDTAYSPRQTFILEKTDNGWTVVEPRRR